MNPPWGCDLVRPPSFTSRFWRSYKKLDKQIQNRVDETIEQIYLDDIPPGLNPEIVDKNRRIWSVRVNDNYRITFSVKQGVPELRNVGNHNYIYAHI